MEGKLDDSSPRPPDLQEWILRHGGYASIPWDKWDAAIAEYKRERRAVFVAELEASKRCAVLVAEIEASKRRSK
jgi:hypothetical protein